MIQSMIRNKFVAPLRQMAAAIQRRRLRGLILSLHDKSPDPEIAEVLDYLRRHPKLDLPLNARPPYDYADGIPEAGIEILHDAAESCPYVMVDGNRIYFPPEFTQDYIRKSVQTAIIEQHANSPHLYLPPDFLLGPNANIALVGASDGIFALSVRDRVAKGWLFEPNAAWHRPLALTLRPWPSKFEIVPKFMSNRDTDNSVSLDSFMRGRGELNFLQADVEGAEASVLEGAAGTLRANPSLRVSICTYHNHDDAAVLSRMLKDAGFQTRFSRGYFVMGLRAPYLRRAVVYGWKPIGG